MPGWLVVVLGLLYIGVAIAVGMCIFVSKTKDE